MDGVGQGWLLVPLSVGHQGCTPTPRLNGRFKRTTLVCSPVLLGDGERDWGAQLPTTAITGCRLHPCSLLVHSVGSGGGSGPPGRLQSGRRSPGKVAMPRRGQASQLGSWCVADLGLRYQPPPGQSRSASLSLGLSVGGCQGAYTTISCPPWPGKRVGRSQPPSLLSCPQRVCLPRTP